MYNIDFAVGVKEGNKLKIEYAVLVGPRGGRYIVENYGLFYLYRNSGNRNVDKILSTYNVNDTVAYILTKSNVRIVRINKANKPITEKQIRQLGKNINATVMMSENALLKLKDIAPKIKQFKNI